MDFKQEVFEDSCTRQSNENQEVDLVLDSLKFIKQEVLEDDSCIRQSKENEDLNLQCTDLKIEIKKEPHCDLNTSSIIDYEDNNCLHQIKTEVDINEIKTEVIEHEGVQDEQMHKEDWNPLPKYTDNQLAKTTDSKISYQSFSDNIARKKTNADYCKQYRQRIRNKGILALSSGAKSSSQRVREHRERQKLNRTEKSTGVEIAVKKTNADYCKEYRQRIKNKKISAISSGAKTTAERVKEYRKRQKISQFNELISNSHIVEVSRESEK